MTQLLLDLEPREERLSRDVESLKATLDKYRKSMHANLGSLKKEINELKHENETLRRSLCRGEKIDYQGFV